MRNLLHFLIFMFVLSLTSCVNDFDWKDVNKEVNTEHSLVIPVGHTRANIFDVFAQIENDGENPEWLADADSNFVYLFLKTELKLPVDETKVARFADSEINPYSVQDRTGLLASHSTVTGNQNVKLTAQPFVEIFDFGYTETENGVVVQRVDKVHIASVKLNVSVDLQDITRTGTTSIIDVNFQLPDVTGSTVYTVTFNPSDPTHKETVIDISDVDITFPFPSTAATTDVLIEVVFKTTTSATIAFNANSDIIINMKAVDADIDRAWGFFNRGEKLTSDDIYADIPTDLFGKSEIMNNHLFFHNPLITFNVTNNIGVPLHFVVDSIKAIDTKTNEERRADFNGNIWTQVPLEMPANIGEEAFSTKTFNRYNGGTNQLFQINPTKIAYDFHVKVDHDRALPVLNTEKPHFFQRPLVVDMNVEAKLRFWFDENTTYYSEDTVKFNGELREKLNFGGVKIEPERVTINIDFKNHLPVQVLGKAIFVDDNNMEVFRKENIDIECPNVDGEGFVLSEKIFTLSIPLIGSDTEKLLKSTKIIFQYTGKGKTTADKINVRGTDYLDAVVSLFVKGKIQTNLDSLFNK